MIRKMLAAARLDPNLYEEVEADPRTTLQAMAVVVIVALATGIGALGSGGGGLNFMAGILFGVLIWAIWAFMSFIIGTTILRTPETEATWGQLARTTGFAQAPGVLRVLGFIPVVGPAIFFATSWWQLAAMVVAVRQALDYRSTWRALGVVVLGWLAITLIQIPLFL